MDVEEVRSTFIAFVGRNKAKLYTHKLAIKALNYPPQESVGDACSEFQRNLMVWVHPSLPFMKLFPRMETKVSSVGQQFTWLPDQQLLNSLKEDW